MLALWARFSPVKAAVWRAPWVGQKQRLWPTHSKGSLSMDRFPRRRRNGFARRFGAVMGPFSVTLRP